MNTDYRNNQSSEAGFENQAQQTLVLNSSVGLQENTHYKDLKYVQN